jgi:predicted XRE-type DNA-binding protein
MKRSKVEFTESSGNVFRDLGFSDPEVRNLEMRAELMGVLRDWIAKVTQVEAAKRLGVSQPRVNDLVRGRIERFSLDALVNLAAKARMAIKLQVFQEQDARGARLRKNARPTKQRPLTQRAA